VQTGAGFIITSHTDHYFDQSITLSTSDDSRTATSPDQTSMSRHGSMVETKAFGSDAAATVVYNSAGRVQSETNPLGGITRYFYNGAGQLEIQRDHLNRETSFEYYPATHMSAGLLKKTIDANGGVTEIIYNERGEQTEVSGSATQKIVYEYNAYGERTGMRTWRVTGGAGDLTQWVYEPATGLQKEKIDAAGKKTNYTYYPSGLVYQRTNARNMTTTLTYNEYGDPLTTVYSSGTANVTRTFDRLGREKTVQDASGLRTITYHTQNGMPDLINYNNTGALASRSLDYIFDGQLLPSGYAATGVSSVAYGYDPQGRLMQVSSGSLAHNYSYLAGTGLQNQRTSSHTGSLRLTETRIIDRMGRLDSIRTANAAGAVLSLHAYQFDQLNRRKEAAREDGRRWHYDYNSRGELESAVKFTADGSKALPAHRFGYDYDGMGNLNSSTRSVGTDPTPVIQRNYVANNLNQYTSITTPGDFTVLAEVPASVATSAVSLAGSLGNRTENIIAWYRNVTNGTTGVLASNSVVMNTAPQQTITGSTYVPKNLVNPQYDFDGNLTDDGLWTYTWDAENRLTSMAMKSNVGYSTRIQLDFIYDSENRRVSKAVSTTTASTWTLQSTTRFLYDGWNMIAQYGFSGSTFTPQAEYVWGLDLTGDMQGAGGVGGLLHARLIDTGNALCLPCYDGNGNIAAWFDAGTSTLIDRREYDSFGGMVSLYKLTANATLHSKLHFGFSTKFTDSESGFLYYGHRYYNPVTQRWLNRDPIEEEGGVNLYGFVGNDGVNFIDYLGMKITKRQVNEYTVMPNPNLPLGLGFTEGQISTVVTFGDGGVIFGPSPQKVNVPDGLKITKIEASSKGNEFKNTEKHELVHVEIYVRYTNMLADEINWLEREFCNPCYELAAAYGNAAANLRRLQTAIENNMFDVQDYTATGRASSAILRVTNERNTNLGKLSAAVNAYNTTGAVFYANKKCITNGSKFIAGEF
jgi:RHS repeat-associated protein